MAKSGSEKRKQTKVVPFRATEGEVDHLAAVAKLQNLSKSAFIRARLFDAPEIKPTRPARRPSVEVAVLSRLLGQLGKCGSNLNQIAHQLNAGEHANRGDITAALAELRELKAEIMGALGRSTCADSD